MSSRDREPLLNRSYNACSRAIDYAFNHCYCLRAMKAVAGDLTGMNSEFTIYSDKEFQREKEDDITRYVSREESVMFYLKSGTQKLVFTDLALIYFRKSTSLDSQAKLVRYPYALNIISDIEMTTASTIDGDFEIEFRMGNKLHFTSVDKTEINILRTNFGDGIHFFNALSILSVEQRKRGFPHGEAYRSYKDVLAPFSKAIEETGTSIMD